MYTLPPLPYSYDALEPYIDAETMKLHHDKHHQAYVDNLNKALEGHEEFLKMDISELVAHLNRVPEEIRTEVRNNAGGHFNHSLFWTMMTPDPKLRTMNSELTTLIDASFGSMDKFKEQFTAAALARFGSGWAWLVKSGDKLQIIDTPNQDNPLMPPQLTKLTQSTGLTPLLCLDVWEHAFYLKYKNVRKDYIAAWWNVVNWSEVEQRYKEAAI